VQAKLGNYTIV